LKLQPNHEDRQTGGLSVNESAKLAGKGGRIARPQGSADNSPRKQFGGAALWQPYVRREDGFICAFAGLRYLCQRRFPEPYALYFLTLSLAFCVSAVAFPSNRFRERVSARGLAIILLTAIVVQTVLVLARAHKTPLLSCVVVATSCLGLSQFFDLRRSRVPIIAITTAAFLFAGALVIRSGKSRIDVYAWQQRASAALKNGLNPYEVQLSNPYATTEFYGPGVVDKNGYLTYGFPYPPLNLFLTFPSFLLLGDVRYAQAFAIALTMVLMSFARPEKGRVGPLAAVMFLLTPCVFLIVWAAWTEPILLLTFSLSMFCACRWRKGLPWALGLFFATKQYAFVALPLLPLLVQGPNQWKQLRSMLLKAGFVVALINLPFLVWNIREFTRAVVLYQIVQPFRIDALSYPAWIYFLTGDKLPIWIAFLALLVGIVIALRYSPRSPAGFAGAVTLVGLLFFSFAKQAFANYYYFVIGAACWAVAAVELSTDSPGSSET
jgi:hypothetical protein